MVRKEHLKAKRYSVVLSVKMAEDGYSVLHLIDIFDVRWERDQQRLVCLQLEKGYNLTIVTSDYNDEWRRDEKSSFAKWEAALEVTNVYHNLAIKPPFLDVVIYIPGVHVFDPHKVVHAYGPWSYSSYLACILKAITKTPVVMRADFSELAHKRAKRSLLLRLLLLAQFKYADAITAFTSTEKEHLLDIGVPEEKIHVVPGGVNLTKFHKVANRTASDSEIVFGYMGRFAAVKGVHRIVSPLCMLLQEYDNLKVIFAGPIQDREYFDHNVGKLSRFANFSYIGPTAADSFFSQCNVVLIPSVSETGAITVREAMAAGRVVVASDIGPIRALITHEVSGLLAKTEADFYRFCRQVIEDHNLRARLQKGALDRSELFSDREMVRKIERIYDSVIASK